MDLMHDATRHAQDSTHASYSSYDDTLCTTQSLLQWALRKYPYLLQRREGGGESEFVGKGGGGGVGGGGVGGREEREGTEPPHFTSYGVYSDTPGNKGARWGRGGGEVRGVSVGRCFLVFVAASVSSCVPPPHRSRPLSSCPTWHAPISQRRGRLVASRSVAGRGCLSKVLDDCCGCCRLRAHRGHSAARQWCVLCRRLQRLGPGRHVLRSLSRSRHPRCAAPPRGIASSARETQEVLWWRVGMLKRGCKGSAAGGGCLFCLPCN